MEAVSNKSGKSQVRDRPSVRTGLLLKNHGRPADSLGLDSGRHVSIFANGRMLAPNLKGNEILSATRRFFPSRLMRWQLGPRSAECGAVKRRGFDLRFGEDFGPLVERKTQGSRGTSSARKFGNPPWFAGRLAKDGPVASYEALLRFNCRGKQNQNCKKGEIQ